MREVDILLISLPGAEARRRLMHAQLDLPGMPPYRVLDAVEGCSLDAPRLAEIYDEASALRISGQPLTPGEIGCAASHLAAHRQIAAGGAGAALVLEDDALLGHQFLRVLGRLLAIIDPGRPEAVLLSHVVRYSAWGAHRVDKMHALCHPHEAYGGHAYLITRAGARAMASAFARVRTVSDDWRYFMKLGIMRVSALVPYIVGTSPLSMESQIGDRRRSPPSGKYVLDKLMFQLLVKPALRLRKQEQTW